MDFFGILYDMKNGKKVPYSKTYFDTLFAAKLAEMQIKTLTGTLPLTFRTSETALRSWTVYGNDFQQEESKSTRLPLSFYTDEDKLRDWTIYGNNTQHNYSAEGTLPLTFTTHTAGAASDWEIEGNNNIGKNLLELSNYTTDVYGIYRINMGDGKLHIYGKSTNQSAFRAPFAVDTTLSAGTYTITGTINNRYRMQVLDITDPSSHISIAIDDGQGADFTLTRDTPIRVNLLVRASAYNLDVDMVLTPMLRLASTSAEFEPYQQGVGQRTKNLLEITAETQTIGEVTFTVADNVVTVTDADKATTARRFNVGAITLLPGTYILSGCPDGGSATVPYTYIIYPQGTSYYDEGDGVTFTLTEERTYNIRIVIYKENTTGTLVFKPMIRPADTSATFIPYGYEIPLNVNNTPQDIYIGSTPLTAGQSISKTSTGVDIATIAGSNTITTELYNKPEMSIEGVDYIGVGEYVNDSWQIPLTVSDGTNTTTVNVPIDAPLTASDTATKTSTGVDIPTYVGTNTISTSLENKPQMLVYYGYKGAGEHVGNTWEFNFITSANGNQQLTRITMDKPLRAGETLTSEQAGVTIPTYADTENTLSLYPSAAGYGNPEMSITYKGD